MRFYVYELIDTITGAAFYVGKGQKGRMYQHVVEATKGVHSKKCERIRSILAIGGEIKYKIVSRHADENEALKAEFDRIAQYGLGNLTNVVPGGVIGAEVYLKRLAEAKARRAAAEKEDLRRGLSKISPQVASMLLANSQGGQFGAWVGGQWLDFTSAFEAFMVRLVQILGIDAVAAELTPYGIELCEAKDGCA
ncbi:GIY-YIG domain-containing protein [Rhizobium phage RHph_Y1_10]|nr:GIY-YIG domain-containing protein [Rhizobium phage RHph_Y1_10]